MISFYSRVISLLLLWTSLFLQPSNATRSKHVRAAQNAIPKYPYEENTTRFCAWWLDNDSDGLWTCPNIERTYEVSMADFVKWNPSLTLPCTTLPTNQSFCIAAYEVPTSPRSSRGPFPSATLTIPVTIPVTISHTWVVTSVATITAVHTTSIYPTPAAGGNGVTTPMPYQPGMVGNCRSFYYVVSGDTCVNIAAKYRVSVEQLISWNPYARGDCTLLLANMYCCVAVL